MAEDCIRWETDLKRGLSSRSGFAISRSSFPVLSWSLTWRKNLLGRFGTRGEARNCAEDILRIPHGIADRTIVEERYGVDLTPIYGPTSEGERS